MTQYFLYGERAKNPYFVYELGLNLYSAEELCYHIFHNLSVIDESFLDERLYSFLRDELKLPRLADGLKERYHSPSDFEAALIYLLLEVGYFSSDEMGTFRKKLAEVHSQIGIERSKARGDLLLSRKRYEYAISTYTAILERSRDNRLPAAFYASVLQHLGVAYARLQLFQEAKECFCASISEVPRETVYQQLYFLCMIQGKPLDELLNDVNPTKLKQWQELYLQIENNVDLKVKSGEVTLLFSKSEPERSKELQTYLQGKKADYHQMVQSKL